MKIKLTLPNNIIREYPAGTTLLEVSRDFAANYQSPIVEGIFNGIGTDLQKPVFENGTVDFITLDTEEGMRVYVRSLLFLFLVAIKELRPEVKIEARNSLGSALFCEITNDIVLSNYDLKALEDYMKELAAKSEPIIYKHINKKEAEKMLDNTSEKCGNDPKFPGYDVVYFRSDGRRTKENAVGINFAKQKVNFNIE